LQALDAPPGMTTLAPASLSTSAKRAPKPLVAPVMNAV
jgi:hypothetical protein